MHGVGISVVNALTTMLDVKVKRGGEIYSIGFANGEKVRELEVIGTCAKKDKGTIVHFMPDASYFDTGKFLASKLRHNLRAKAVLCPGLHIIFHNEEKDEKDEWFYENGLKDYLVNHTQVFESLPDIPFIGASSAQQEAVDWAIQWLPEGGELIQESYVNLIPTAQGGTHVNGFRTGLLDAMREFCEYRNLIPRGIKLGPEDVWEKACFVLSAKLADPQFSGQTKERLSSRQASSFIAGVVKDSFSLYLNEHTEVAEKLAEMFINSAQSRSKAAKKVTRKKITQGPALHGKLADCASKDAMEGELFLVEGDSAGGSAKQARDRQYQAVMPLRGKILNTWEVDSGQILASQEVHDIAVALGVDVNNDDLSSLRYGRVCILADADSDGLHIATLLCALFVKHFPALVKAGHVFVAMPPLYRIDIGKEVYYALDDSEKNGIIDRIEAEKKKGQINVQRFKGLGEMNPLQLRETTMDRDTRRLVQLTLTEDDNTLEVMDMLLSKKRASDRKNWLESKGDLAEI